ncbi:glycosyltransferase [Spirosoma sp. BT702]|uniref:Glycosyltransferase n=1 Tax=Spirosoma profusum TaxID=2771354 RepID=A0A926XVU8_9BACT|nr:glycosyltransferase [Spirosoma profusum]MBD2700696.1 glycosyltransferase [Spirosoma profusum]
MRILIVCSGNAPTFDFRKHQAFIYDQVEALKQLDLTLTFDYFFINGKGFTGYLSCLTKLTEKLKSQAYDCIHAHVALSGMLANLQRRVPVITTFHGSDINLPKSRIIAALVDALSRKTVYISSQLARKALYANKEKQAIVPCGIDFDLFIPRNKVQSRQQLGFSLHKKYVLFSAGFNVPIKNYPLAKSAIELLDDESVELLELTNYTREEVALMFSAVDVALMTSFSEGSPQFVKEALACNCPVVSTDVGDVQAVMGEVAGCYVTSYDPIDVAAKIRCVLASKNPISARAHVQRFDNRLIAEQIRSIYYQLNSTAQPLLKQEGLT